MQQTNTELFKWAENLYIRLHASIADVASMTGLDKDQITQWSVEHHWNDRRMAAFTANQQQLERLYKMIDELTIRSQNAGPDASLKDAGLIKQYAAAIRNLQSQDSVIKTIQVARPFTLWLLKKDLALTKTITLWFDQYIKEMHNPELLQQ